MDKHEFFDEEPGLDGPDYVALVIEWDELADKIEDEIAAEPTKKIERPLRLGRLAAAGAGVLGVIGLAAWGIHRLRA
jgi:hypothetical protein